MSSTRDKKNNRVSLRLSDEIFYFIESFPGEKFSDKFDSLVGCYKNDLPEREQRLKQLEQSIARRSAQLDKLSEQINQLDKILCDVFYLQPIYCRIKTSVKKIMEEIEDNEDKEV